MSNDAHHQPSTLRARFESTLCAFENAADNLQDGQPNLDIRRRALTWLEHVIALLISWSTDIRIESDSLSAIEGSEVEERLMALFTEIESGMRAYLQLMSLHDE